MSPERREVLRLLGCGLGGANFIRSAIAQAKILVDKLDDHATLITGAGNNIVVLSNEAGTLLVDCGDASHAAEVLKLAGTLRTVVNTHWHIESSGGNETMARSGAAILAHVNTRLWMTQEVVHDWENKTFPRRAPEALPSETFYVKGTRPFGDEVVEYGLLPMAHTDGDIYVRFVHSNILAVGDVVQAGRFPVLDWATGGWIGGMQEAHRALLQISDDKTKIVPGAGPVFTRSELQSNLELLTRVREKLVRLMKQGMGPKDMIAGSVLEEFRNQLSGDADSFIYTAYRGLWGHVRELGGIV